MIHAPHPSDGSDERGRELDIVIRIGPNGRVYLHDITDDLLPVALSLNPTDIVMQQRVKAAGRLDKETHT